MFENITDNERKFKINIKILKHLLNIDFLHIIRIMG